jgi:hypothetical protein
LAAAVLAAAGCSAASPTHTSTSSSPAHSGDLAVRVTGVSAILEPYNPQLSDHGIPAEQVRFSVDATTRFSCRIVVRHHGHVVGTTTWSFGPPPTSSNPRLESVPVDITGATFAGTSSNAQVTCRRA